MPGVWVQFLVGEIRSHMPHLFKKKKQQTDFEENKDNTKYRRKLLFILTSSERKEKSLHSWNKNRMS